MNITGERSYSTPLSNSYLLPFLLASLARQKHTSRTTTTFQYEYDYIVVGAGGAGSVVAARLSEIPSVNVLVLEAGHEPPLLTDVPALLGYFWNTDVDWKFHTVPQKYAARGLVNREVSWATGKMLGGSSNFNFMLYVRGNHKNYNDWAEQGAKGWSYTEVFPYFLKLEDNRNIQFLINNYHRAGGPMTFEQPKYQTEMKTAIYETATGMGYTYVDPNAATQTGFYDFQAFIRDNQRCSSLKAYLVPAENRPNLDIVANAFVTKILIQDGRAIGVQFDYDCGARYEIYARKEVIVSAGTVNTAKLLMLSGIGPREELQKFNIPVFADLPVGKNLHDHEGTYLSFTVDPIIMPFDEKLVIPDNIEQYINSRSGPLASTYGALVVAFLKDQEVHPDVDFPNYELYINEMPISFTKGSGLKSQVYNQVFKPYENETIFTCAIQQLQPRSRGTVTLKSSNPYDPPIIDPNYLQDPKDVEDLVQGLKVCRKLINSEPLRKLGAKEFATLIPGCELVAEFEEEYFRFLARSILRTYHHPVGTSKMGHPGDVTTVVDPEVRVKNIKGLRVVDGSVMPKIISGNVNIPIIMIAEKASDIIKQSINNFCGYPVLERIHDYKVSK